jgi:8-oxo-dGTP pyrophosphatase MutT (NUDIX family)
MEGTLCLVLKGNKVLMKLAVRGISKGRWNFPGGKVDSGETPRQASDREVLEETGLKVSEARYHGKLFFAFDGRPEKDWYVHVFSAKRFAGELKESDEGPLKWFDADALPVEFMWPGDRIWFPHVLAGTDIAGSFTYDGKGQALLRYALDEPPASPSPRTANF